MFSLIFSIIPYYELLLMRKKHLVLLLLCSHYNWAQQTNFKIPDSLHDKSYGYLSQGFLNSKEDSLKALPYAQTWLQKAKKENNAMQMVGAYKALLHKASQKAGYNMPIV